MLVSEELIRVAILWHELWHEGLEEASRLYFGERNIKGRNLLDMMNSFSTQDWQPRKCCNLCSILRYNKIGSIFQHYSDGMQITHSIAFVTNALNILIDLRLILALIPRIGHSSQACSQRWSLFTRWWNAVRRLSKKRHSSSHTEGNWWKPQSGVASTPDQATWRCGVMAPWDVDLVRRVMDQARLAWSIRFFFSSPQGFEPSLGPVLSRFSSYLQATSSGNQ